MSKLTYTEAKKIKREGVRGSYFQWSTESIPIALWKKASDFNTGDPSAKEYQKFNKSSIAKYRKVFESRHGADIKTEAEWKNMWSDFQDEIKMKLIPGYKPLAIMKPVVKKPVVKKPPKKKPVLRIVGDYVPLKKTAASAKTLTEEQKKSLLEDILNEAEEYRYLDYVSDPTRYTFSEMSKARIARDTKKAKALLKLVKEFFATKKTPKFNAYFKKLIKDGKADNLWDGENVGRQSESQAREFEGVVVQFGDEPEDGGGLKYFIGLAEKYEAGI